jgi:hypothetical protein
MSRRASRTTGRFAKYSIRRFLLASTNLWRGVKMHLPAGMASEACCSLPSRVRNSLRGRRFWEMAVARLSIIRSIFSGGSSMVRRIPSKIQPRISLRTAQTPSPARSFLKEMGSSSARPDSGGGKTEWIA